MVMSCPIMVLTVKIYFIIIKIIPIIFIIFLIFIEVFEWCRKNHFELIVLEEIADEMDTTGIERVKQALYAHHWPNLKAKCI